MSGFNHGVENEREESRELSTTVIRMSGLRRDGTAEPVSRGQILRRERGQGKQR